MVFFYIESVLIYFSLQKMTQKKRPSIVFMAIITWMMFIGIWGVFASLTYFSADWEDPIPLIPNNNLQDTYRLNENILPIITDPSDSSSWYSSWLRMTLNTSEWFLESDQYGQFYPVLVEGRIDSIPNTNPECNWWRSYTLSWSLQSTWAWGLTLNLQNWSYFCPSTNKVSIIVKSDRTQEWVLTGTGQSILVETEDADGNVLEVAWAEVFNNDSLCIEWVVTNSVWKDFTWSEIEITEWASATNKRFITLGWWQKIDKALLKSYINRNVATIQKTFPAITDNSNPVSEPLKDISYYNFSEESNGNAINGNAGQILVLWNDVIGDAVEVQWEKVILLEWGNLYIKWDIINTDNKSSLTIIITRDKENRGWNIYIDPHVTNIDAYIIAEGSMMNYNGSDVLTSWAELEQLRRQLLIYGFIDTKNWYWTDDIPLGSDHDVYNNWLSSIYNLAKLRTFKTALAPDTRDPNCTLEWEVIWLWNLTHKFAWKRQCYLTDEWTAYSWTKKLRVTEKLCAVTIEKWKVMPSIMSLNFNY